MSSRSRFQQFRKPVLLILCGSIATFAGEWGYRRWTHRQATISPAPATVEASNTEAGTNHIDFPRESWQAAALELSPVRADKLSQSVELTGKVTLNEDRVAHLFPLVEGRVDEVKVHLGDRVKQGELLVVIQSKEVGQTMLQLYQDRLQRDFAVIKDGWTQKMTANAQAMIDLMRAGAEIDAIEKQLTDRPIGEYRDRLMSAYVGYYKSQKQIERLRPLTQDGAVTGKQLLEAETELNATRATMQSLLEQIQQDARQAATVSAQTLKELQTRVSVDETNLRILGFEDADLKSLDPAAQGEAVSHYPVHAPFDGTVISKDVVLMERVGPQQQILSIADLTTVWVTTNIYEEHLPLLRRLHGKEIVLRSRAWPGESFEARIFYAGDLVDETSRTIAMRAIADNPSGLLKPGMFVNVELSGDAETVLQVPPAAVQEHEGKSFVFVPSGEDGFERRDVTLGRRNAGAVEVLAGVQAGEQVVTRGGFVLKSRMLSALLEE